MSRQQTEAQRKYAEMLKDPRWKARRQEILRRDDYACRGCGAKDPAPFIEHEDGYREEVEIEFPVQLEVHHKWYAWGQAPWDYPGAALVTLCESCHDTETAYQKEAVERLTQAVRTRFLSRDISILANAIEQMQAPFGNRGTARLINWILTTPEVFGLLQDVYESRQGGLRPISDFLPGILYALEQYEKG
jgi:5-methylcytosine-specific restriction endonuclease McrA